MSIGPTLSFPYDVWGPGIAATISGSSTFNNLIFGADGNNDLGNNSVFTIATGTTLTVQGYLYSDTFYSSVQFLGGGQVNAQGNVETMNNPGYATGTAAFFLTGTGTQVVGDNTVNGQSTLILPNLTVAKPSGIAYATNSSVDMGNLTVSQGELQLATGTATASFQVNGSVTVASGTILSDYPQQASSTLILGSSVVNNGLMFFDGPGVGCGSSLPNYVIIQSTHNGTQRSWSGSGTFWMRYVDVRDQSAAAISGGINDWNGTNRSNNSNWNFPTGPRAQLIQSVTSNTAATSLTLPAFTLKPRTGDLMVVAVSAENQSILTPTDNASNTYVLVASSTFGPSPSYALNVYYAKNIMSTSSFTVTVNDANSPGGPLLSAGVFDYTDMSTSSTLDSYSANTGASTTALTSFSAAATAPGDLYFGALTFAAPTTAAAASGWNTESSIINSGSAQSLYVEDLATSTLLTTSSQWTAATSTSYADIIALFETPHSAGYAPSGTLDSATFDTGLAGGAALNSFTWQGTAPSGTAVKFQFAVSSSSNGQWNYMGPDGVPNSVSSYFTGSPGTPIGLVSTYSGYALFSGYRYFRYHVTLFSDAAHLYTPTVTQVVVNWSP